MLDGNMNLLNLTEGDVVLNKSDVSHVLIMVGGVNQSVIVPSSSKTVVIECNVECFLNRTTGTLDWPLSTEMNTQLEYKPYIRKVVAGETLKFITKEDGIIMVSFYY